MITPIQEELFLTILQQHTGRKDRVKCTLPLSGGDINNALKIETAEGVWFAKWNKSAAFPGMFEAEAKGLQLLASTDTICLPHTIGSGQNKDISMLVLEFITSFREKKDFWIQFGQNLARMHRNTQPAFGLDHQNYIGSLPQINHEHTNWIEFFIVNRLEIQIKMARDQGKIDAATIRQCEKMYPSLPDFFPIEPPALLHGDLWSGNFMTNEKGEPCIIDPAVYYGHRLMDLGMSKLFGGFSHDFYQAYHAEYPLEKNWTRAIDIANLYPLMVHVNLFGGGYLSSVKGILKPFV